MLNADLLDGAVRLIGQSENILITTHIKPDGDACGSVTAMTRVLQQQGKNVKILMLSEVPRWYEFLFDEKPAVFEKDVTSEQLSNGDFIQADMVVLVDVNSENQLEGFSDYLKLNSKKVLVLDHHVTNDGLGAVELIDTSAAAAGLIVFDLIKYANWPIDEKIAEALFMAIATDTGWFRFTNTDSRTHRVCAELLDKGVDSASLYHRLYRNFSSERFALMNLMLSRLQLHFDGRYACQEILGNDLVRTGATIVDTENLIDECQRIGTVEVAALFTELNDGRIKCSLRSKGDVDVRKIAQKFGGGGHTMAAGTYVTGTIQEAQEKIKAQIQKQLCL